MECNAVRPQHRLVIFLLLSLFVFQSCLSALAYDVIGNPNKGTNIYPVGDIPPCGSFRLGAYAAAVNLVIDPVKGYGYVGTNSRSDNLPRIYQVTLGPGKNPPSSLRYITLARENPLTGCALIDPQKGYAYFGTYTNPGKILKMKVGTASAGPSIIASLALNPGEDVIACGIISTSAGYAWLATNTWPAKIVKVNLGQGGAPPVRIGGISLNSSEGSPQSAVIDMVHNCGYFATSSTSGAEEGYIVKVGLGQGSALPTRLGAVKMGQWEGPCTAAVADPQGGYGYFGTNIMIPSKISKILFGNNAVAPANVGSVSRDPEGRFLSAAADLPMQAAYFGGNNRIARLDINKNVTLPTFMGSQTLGERNCNITAMASDSAKGFLYYAKDNGTSSSFGKLDIWTSSCLRLTGSLLGTPGDVSYGHTLVDSVKGYAYLDTYNEFGRSPYEKNRIIKMALGEGSASPRVVASLDFPTERFSGCAVIDARNGYAYYGVSGDAPPARILKVALGDGDSPPVIVSSIDAVSAGMVCADIDAAKGYAYFAGSGYIDTYNQSGPLIAKIRLGAGNAAPEIVSRQLVTKPFGGMFTVALVDPINGFGYFVLPANTGGQGGYIVKASLGNGGKPPVVLGSAQLGPNESNIFCGAIDTKNGYAYFGADWSPAKIVKVALGKGSALPRRVGALTLAAEEDLLRSAAIDTDNGCAYFGRGFGGAAYGIVKISLGTGDAPPKRVGAISTGSYRIASGALDVNRGYAWFGTNTHPGIQGPDTPKPCTVLKYAFCQKNYIKANKISVGGTILIKEAKFFSHRSGGNLRLAIYDTDSPKRLIWQSGSTKNTANKAWLTFPISSGIPKSLALRKGTYWLAFQTDSTLDVPSYSRGNMGSGFCADYIFAAYPESLATGSLTNETWSIYLNAFPASAGDSWMQFE